MAGSSIGPGMAPGQKGAMGMGNVGPMGGMGMSGGPAGPMGGSGGGIGTVQGTDGGQVGPNDPARQTTMTQAQMQQLRLQIMAYRYLARNQPLPDQLRVALETKRSYSTGPNVPGS